LKVNAIPPAFERNSGTRMRAEVENGNTAIPDDVTIGTIYALLGSFLFFLNYEIFTSLLLHYLGDIV
jgi:hypothetical protein